jgi:hypothetical protein
MGVSQQPNAVSAVFEDIEAGATINEVLEFAACSLDAPTPAPAGFALLYTHSL